MSNETALSKSLDSFRMSPRYRELLVYPGQSDTYQGGSDSLSLLLGLGSSDSQIHRLTNHYGALAGDLLAEASPELELTSEDRVYAQVDGSMVFIRQEGWKETKLGRTFIESNCLNMSEKRKEVRHSEYTAHLGSHLDFEQKMELLVDKYERLGPRLVFINDGAPWIANWINANYPEATSILDFFHACEYLSEFIEAYFGKIYHKQYYQQWAERLKNQGAETILKQIKELTCDSQKAQKAKDKVSNYYQNNLYRMDYPKYLQEGLFIGSGAIEAAHRTVIQKRLKLSGQRWTIKGAQHVLNLRTLNMSQRWNELQNTLRAA